MFTIVKRIVVVLLIICSGLGGQRAVAQTRYKANRQVKYRVAKKEYVVGNERSLLLSISIAPKNLNCEDMVTLAVRLKGDNSKEPRVVAGIFTNYKAAKRFTLSSSSPDYADNMRALRGEYHLDRINNKETISFSPTDSGPREAVTINLDENLSKKCPL